VRVVVKGEDFEYAMSVNIANLLKRLKLDERDKLILLALEEGRLTQRYLEGQSHLKPQFTAG